MSGGTAPSVIQPFFFGKMKYFIHLEFRLGPRWSASNPMSYNDLHLFFHGSFVFCLSGQCVLFHKSLNLWIRPPGPQFFCVGCSSHAEHPSVKLSLALSCATRRQRTSGIMHKPKHPTKTPTVRYRQADKVQTAGRRQSGIVNQFGFLDPLSGCLWPCDNETTFLPVNLVIKPRPHAFLPTTCAQRQHEGAHREQQTRLILNLTALSYTAQYANLAAKHDAVRFSCERHYSDCF